MSSAASAIIKEEVIVFLPLHTSVSAKLYCYKLNQRLMVKPIRNSPFAQSSEV